MKREKLTAGTTFPTMTIPRLGGGSVVLGKPNNGHDWQLIVIYRGKHCPMCTSYLKELDTLVADFNALGVDVVAVSADPVEKAKAQIDLVSPGFAVGYDLNVDQMRRLGVYISNPRSPEETDRPFSEPGLFVVNADGNLQLTDISNAPFARPELTKLVGGIRFIRNPENNYPIRGMA